MEIISCILILDHNDNTQYYVPAADYQSNPIVGTVVLREKVGVVEPVVKEDSNYWKVEGPAKPKQSASSRMSSDQIYLQMVKEQIEQRRKRDDWMRERGK